MNSLYSSDFEVQLVKKRKVYVGQKGQLNLRENVLGTAIVDQKTCMSQADCGMMLRLVEAGVAGGESSWGVTGVIEVQVGYTC